jgi:hypothetical protein
MALVVEEASTALQLVVQVQVEVVVALPLVAPAAKEM